MTCEACKTIPPVIAEGYENKGSWIELAGLKTCTSLYLLTLQGADALSAALDCLVIVPDFFKGGKMEEEWMTKPTESNKPLKEEFFKFAMDFKNFAPVLDEVVEKGKAKWGSVEAWGAYGLCWGGKVVALTSGASTPFKASGQVHPARLETEDAKKITIPHIVLASNGEDEKIVNEYKEVLVGEGKKGEV
ncbi:putative AIM2 family protein, partial [Lachnellula suecica]